MTEPGDFKISPEVAEQIAQGIREGVSFTCSNWPQRDMTVTAIHWHLGDPNALATAIIEHVRGPMALELEGRRYIITPYDESGGRSWPK